MNEGIDAATRNQRGNGADLRFTLTLASDGKGARGRALSASVVLKPLNEQQQARFDAEVQTLLADMVRQQVERKEG